MVTSLNFVNEISGHNIDYNREGKCDRCMLLQKLLMKGSDHFTEVQKNQTCDFAINISIDYVRE